MEGYIPRTTADWAVFYAELGIPVLIVTPNGKEPLQNHGVKDATTNAAELRETLEAYPECNLGLAMGNGYVCIDIDVDKDGIDGNDYIDEWEQKHGKLKETWTAVTGGGGTHIIYRVDEDFGSPPNHEIKIDIRGKGSYIVVEPSIHKSGNPYYWDISPLDTDCAWAGENELALIRSVFKSNIGVLAKDREKSGKGRSAHGEHGFQLPSYIPIGARNATMYSHLCQLQQFGKSDEHIRKEANRVNEEVCERPMPRHELNQIIRQALSMPKGEDNFDYGIETNAASLLSNMAMLHGEQPKSLPELTRNKRGVPNPTMDNATTILRFDDAISGKLWLDEMKRSVRIGTPVPWDSRTNERDIEDWDIDALYLYMEQTYGYTAKNHVSSAVDVVANQNIRNNLKEFLLSLTWDGTPRIDTMLSDCLGVDDGEYERCVARVTVFGAVERALNNGAKFDTMTVLIGDQGIGKSWFCRQLACDEQWFVDGLTMFSGKDAIEMIRGAWIVEVGEMAALSGHGQTVESNKNFITTSVDTIRPAYAKRTQQWRRSCVFIGTTNKVMFLTDRTGNRRFLPVMCHRDKVKRDLWASDIGEYFTQIWAEAVHKWKSNQKQLQVPKELYDEYLAKSAEHMVDDPREGLIENYLEAVLMDFTRTDKRVCALELFTNALGYDRETHPRFNSAINDIHEIVQNLDTWEKGDKRCYFKNWGKQTYYVPKS